MNLATREYWTCTEAARVLGRGHQFWARLFDDCQVAGYRTATGKRFIQANSARRYLDALCSERVVSDEPSPADRAREGLRRRSNRWLARKAERAGVAG